MKKQSIWSFRLTTASLVLIPVAVGINYIGKTLASVLKLPLWLDAIGTILAGMLGGPIIGALSGLINNVIYGLTMDPISFVYGITSFFMGLVAGILSYKGWISSWPKAVVVGIVVGLTAVIISTPLNIGFWGGQTGNLWGDALFAFVMAKTQMVWLASFLDELVVDLPDKIITVLISYATFRSLPNNIKQIYKKNDQMESLD
jgi:energy-coupling factor transport system substrate-specific component